MTKKQEHLLRLPSLQFFGGNGEPPAGEPTNPEEAGQGGASGAQPTNTNPEGQQQTPPAQGGEPTPTPQENMFTQEQVNNFVARETRTQVEQMLKELGIEDFDNAKEGMEQFNQWKEAQLTEAEKQAKQLETTSQELGTVKQENQALQAQIFAMKAGVIPDSVSDVVTLAQGQVTDEVTLEQAISQVVEKYPQFKQPEQAPPEEAGNFPQFTNGTHQSSGGQVSELDKWKDAFK